MTAPEQPVPAERRLAPPLLELRQYRLHPGRRDDLVELFDAEFVDTQEAVGITVVGQFRDLDRPDHFVWMRAFPDPITRTAALSAFYGGPVWAAHRDRANATMIDSDDVLVLRPHRALAALHLPVERRYRSDDDRQAPIVVVIEHVGDDADVVEFVTTTVASLENEARTLGVYVTDPIENGLPRLPVRDDRVAVWIGRGVADAADSTGTAAGSTAHRQVLRLVPTRRSLLG